MIKWKTSYTNNIGHYKYPIYLIVDISTTPISYDLWCELEIYAGAWTTVYEDSVKKYEMQLDNSSALKHKGDNENG